MRRGSCAPQGIMPAHIMAVFFGHKPTGEYGLCVCVQVMMPDMMSVRSLRVAMCRLA